MAHLFEVSWEVCNRTTEVYTAIRTKVPHVTKQFGEGYYLVGPWLNETPDFRDDQGADFELLRSAMDARGVSCRFGRWQIAGEPKVILVDYRDLFDVNGLLHQLWQDFSVDSLGGRRDYLDAVLFGRACAEVISIAYQTLLKDEHETVVHCHQWSSACTILHLKKELPEIATVLTEHGTVLGQAIASAGRDINAELEWINPSNEAEALGVRAKHNIEFAAVQAADCVTAVSHLTAREVEAILQRQPRVVLNGVNASDKPDHLERREESQGVKQYLRHFSENFLQKQLPTNTRFLVSTGQYDFSSKGFDLLIDSLSLLEQRLSNDDPPVVALFLIPACHRGVIESVYQRVCDGRTWHEGGVGLLTHQLADETFDPIINNCRRVQLRNSLDNKVNVVFIPAVMDGHDGLLNISYQTLLLGCDVGVFPALYEPWGYTALESAELALPTIISNQTGFGRWLLELSPEERRGIWILDRSARSYQDVVEDLVGMLQQFVLISEEEWVDLARAARRTVLRAEWIVFYRGYQDVFKQAISCVRQRSQLVDSSRFSEESLDLFKGGSRHRREPLFRSFTAVAPLPKELEGLYEIAHNLWWSWDPDARRLFSMLDARLWQEVSHNPVLFLSRISNEVLQQKMVDDFFLELYGKVLERFTNYVKDESFNLKKTAALSCDRPVVYLSMEYGLHECLPIYSGGLGILSGDHLKSASDHNIPLVGVGLFYRRGYFSQTIDAEGNQIAHYPQIDCSVSPIKILHASDGSEARVYVELGGRKVGARIWVVQVGRIKLYLMDSDIEENEPEDRQLSAQLYGGDRRMRLSQEILLGIGGVNFVLDVLGLDPSVWHLNEGHVALSLLERCRRFMQRGFNFQEAREAVKVSSVFTTHTPVPAGNETFQPELMSHFLREYVESWPITFEQLLEMGADNFQSAREKFSMTVLALKLSSRSNGVSKLHGKVCRQMWRDVWKGVNVDEIPIDSITNGVHLQTWISPNMRALLDKYAKINWGVNEDQPKVWAGVKSIPDEELWAQNLAQKKTMVECLREKISAEYAKRGEDAQLIRDTLRQLSPYKLTAAFARRFATYKRPELMIRDLERLKRLLNDPDRPMQILVAGKAHPADSEGQSRMRELIAVSKLPELRGRLVFIEGYDMGIGRLLTSGVDIWLNNPIRPHEASGTSGMKAAANGTVNFSILDGWWDEAYHPGVGWAIDPVDEVQNREHQDELDFENMMQTLEHQIVPLFYERDENGLPRGWLQIAKTSIMEIGPLFSTHRMLRDYYSEMYYSTAKRSDQLLANNGSKLRSLTYWKQRVVTRFAGVQIRRVDLHGISGDQMAVGSKVEVDVFVAPSRLNLDEILVEFVYGIRQGDSFLDRPEVVSLSHQGEVKRSGVVHYRGEVLIEKPGSYLFATRVVPIHPCLVSPQETGLMCWG